MQKINQDKVKLLLSVMNEQEVSYVKDYADIIDLKNPNDGPLGSLDINQIKKIIKRFGDKYIFSATLGNKMGMCEIVKKIRSYENLGLNYIKVGYFSNSKPRLYNFLALLNKNRVKTKIVLVLFAENRGILQEIKENMSILVKNGIQNLLVDTNNKYSLSLTEIYTYEFLRGLVQKAQDHDLKIGLAGKIKFNQLNNLLNLSPHIIGMRGAICKNDSRDNHVQKEKVVNVYQLFNSYKSNAQAVAGA